MISSLIIPKRISFPILIEEVDGYEYKLYNGSTLIDSITVEKDMTIRVVYTEIVVEPDEPDTPNEPDTPSEPGASDNSTNEGNSSSSDSTSSGCFGTVNTSSTLIFFVFAAMVMFKGLLRKGGKENE